VTILIGTIKIQQVKYASIWQQLKVRILTYADNVNYNRYIISNVLHLALEI
jgi:hypothetical protein